MAKKIRIIDPLNKGYETVAELLNIAQKNDETYGVNTKAEMVELFKASIKTGLTFGLESFAYCNYQWILRQVGLSEADGEEGYKASLIAISA